MPIVTPDEPYTRPPHMPEPDVRAEWDGRLDVEDGVGVVQGARITEAPSFDECRELHLLDCEVEGLSFSTSGELNLHVERSALSICDLSQIRLETLQSSSINGSKLFGTDLAGAQMSDATIRNSTFRYLNLRMATLTRVAFVGSEMSEIDLYDSVLHDVSFDECRLEQVNFDKCQMERVDFREATRLGLVSTTSMKGSIILESQVLDLAYQFAMASGVDIEPNESVDDDG